MSDTTRIVKVHQTYLHACKELPADQEGASLSGYAKCPYCGEEVTMLPLLDRLHRTEKLVGRLQVFVANLTLKQFEKRK